MNEFGPFSDPAVAFGLGGMLAIALFLWVASAWGGRKERKRGE